MREDLVCLAKDFREYFEALDPGAEASNARPVVKVKVSKSRRDLSTLRTQVLECTQCSLHQTRRTVVFGEGSENADLMFIGEAPGGDEDVQGRPFVGRAGQLLTKIIESISLKREDVFIGNVLKCRPPSNRDPSPGEIAACKPHLDAQIALIHPKIICALGRFAAQTLLKTDKSLTRMRGGVHEWGPEGAVKLITTYHPAACLRYPQYKRPVWEDMKLLREQYRTMGGNI